MARTRSPQPSRRPARRGENPSRLDATENSRHDRAWLAVKAFNETVPTLTSFARAVTGKKSVRVQMSKTRTATDGENIYIVPPIELGDRIPHERMVCEKRDPATKILLCPACATRELVMGRLFHELAHITGDSHAKPLQYERRKIKDMIKEWHPSEACDHAGSLFGKASSAAGHQSMSEAFHPFLSGILKSIEDARVDAKMYRTRPGLKVPTAARRRHVFSKGVNHLDGTTTFWREAPLNVQVIIGLLMLSAGEVIEDDYLAPEVIEVLRDEELTRIASKTLFASSVHNSLEISIELFLRLQEMGVLFVPKCEPPPPMPSLNAEPGDPNDDPSNEESDDDAGSGSGSDAPDSDSKDESSGDADDAGEQSESGQSDGAGSGDDAGDDASGDEEDGGQDDKDDLGDGSPSFENESSRGDGDDQEDGDSDTKSDDRDVQSDDDREEPAEQGDAGSEGDDDPGAGDSDSDAGDPSEPEPGDEDGEPGGGGAGGGGAAGEEDRADQEPDQGDDGSGKSDDDGSDGEPGEDAEGDGAGAGASPGDDDTDAEADAEAGVEDDPGAGDGDGDDDLDPTEDDLDGTEAPSSVTDASVWDQENPEQIIDGPGDEPEPEPIEFDGTPEEIVAALQQFLGHGHEEEIDAEILDVDLPSAREEERNEEAVKVAVNQQGVFDTSSHTVRGVEVVQYPWPVLGWCNGYPNIFGGEPRDFMPSEAIIGGSLMQARLVFSANKLAKNQGNLKSGRINTRVLGRRAAIEDPRLFKRKTLPGKRDYFVVIGIDCSGSTQNFGRNARIKRAVFAKAELLNRLGIKFAIYGHTGGRGDFSKGWDSRRPGAYDGMTEVWMMEVKSPDEPWNDKTRKALADLPPVCENLDGHSLEFYRKVAEKSTATDRIVMYYTDGSMPAANYEEELAILQSEIETCRKKGINLMAVGINTDSPEQYGFDTVQVDGDEDLSKVVAHLKKKLVG